ncbi:MAG TPA: multicopper oxidase family protein [Gemmatimonadales bacterium]
MKRRTFVAGLAAGVIPRFPFARPSQRDADYTLRIAPTTIDLAPGIAVRTLAYNGTVPGPLLRLREGRSVTVNVINDTENPEYVHWHGLELPAAVDGAPEEGTPPVPPHGSQSYTFTPTPRGTRWYHSHVMAGHDLHRSLYSGQFGFLVVDPAADPGRYDRELFVAMHDWNPYISGGDDGFWTVGYTHASINGRMLGQGDPIHVRAGERVLLRVLNASADMPHWLALPGHEFTVIALDGNPVPVPRATNQLRLDPAERVDAIVTMNRPGIWILGEVRDHLRRAGLGVVVEYANQGGSPVWETPAPMHWDYFDFAAPGAMNESAPAEPVPILITSQFRGHGTFEGWKLNGHAAPEMDRVFLSAGHRYRLEFDNQSTEDHPVHLHRHTFELVGPQGLTGIRKDTVLVAAGQRRAVEFVANNPGPTLLHCHLQDHMDAGFMMMFDYR